MAGELITKVDSDPASCRATADWLSTLSAAVDEAETAVRGAQAASFGCWVGPAGDAYRGAMSPIAGDAGTLQQTADRAREALTAFADEIDTVIARMTQARQVAAAAELIVTPTAILPPGPPPAPAPAPGTAAGGAPSAPTSSGELGALPAPTQGPTMAEAEAHMHAQKVAAWNEVTVTVAEARLKEAAAHRALDAAMDEGRSTVETLKTIGQTALGAGLGTIQGLRDEADDLLAKAELLREQGADLQRGAAESTGTQSMRAVAANAPDGALQQAQLTEAQAKRLLRPIEFIPERVQHAIAASPGGAIPDGNSWTKPARGVVRGVPGVGTVATVFFAGADLAMGKPADQVAAETGAGVGGAAVGAASGAAIGSVFPGPGTAIGAVIGGVIGGLTATEGVTEAYED